MKPKHIFLVLFSSFVIAGYSQSLSVNQFDSTGKKDGKWIIYLDKDWNKIEDSTRALFKRYTWYDHGVNIYPMGRCGGRNYKLKPNTTGTKALVDGEYKWYDGHGKLSSVHVFQNGEYVSCKEYYTSGELHQFFDYTKKCEGYFMDGQYLFTIKKATSP